LFGADDELVPLDMVDAFSALLDQHPSLGHESHTFAGRHFFANESRSRRYLPESADAAWAVALQFLATRMASTRQSV
jgi:dienelactone hydrolase